MCCWPNCWIIKENYPGEAQVSDSIGHFSEYDNVEDFVVHYVLRLAERYADHGRDDVADALYDALDQYLSHLADIRLIGGQVYLVPHEMIEESDEAWNYLTPTRIRAKLDITEHIDAAWK